MEDSSLGPGASFSKRQDGSSLLIKWAALMFDATLVCDNNTRYKLGVISRQVLVSRLSVIIQNIHHH